MDKDEIIYPREFVEKLAKRNLRGIRFPKKWGGRGMSWVADVAASEERSAVSAWRWGAPLSCPPSSVRP